jgi:hypothetical protein
MARRGFVLLPALGMAREVDSEAPRIARHTLTTAIHGTLPGGRPDPLLDAAAGRFTGLEPNFCMTYLPLVNGEEGET